MSIDAALRAQISHISSRWEVEVVREVAELAPLPRALLIDHLPEFLDGLSHWIAGERELAATGFRALSEGHAVNRQRAGIAVESVVAEYATLRRIIFEQLARAASAAELTAVVVSLNDGLDVAIAEALRRYQSTRDEARDRFVAILGHDLRDPLAAIELSAAMLKETGLDAAQADLVARLARAASRMERMIGDVLDFARGRLASGIPVQLLACDMAKICEAAVDEANASAGAPVSFEATGDLRGMWDADRVGQAIANLLRNARHHGRGPVTVRAWESDDRGHVFTSVTNLGAPISPHLLRTLFDPFSRPAGPRRPGLGLGLFIVQQIALAHGAVCHATSTAEAGTTFAIDWPRVPLETTPGRAAP